MKLRFYFVQRGLEVKPRIIAVKMLKFPRRAVSLSRWYEIRATLDEPI
jgi:hypothetical protein